MLIIPVSNETINNEKNNVWKKKNRKKTLFFSHSRFLMYENHVLYDIIFLTENMIIKDSLTSRYD